MSRAVPAYRKHKNGQAYIRCKRINGGKNLYLGTYGSPESIAKYHEVLRQLAAADNSPAMLGILNRKKSGDLLGEVIERYLDHARQRYSNEDGPTSEAAQMEAALEPVVELFGGISGRDFTPRHLVAIQDYLTGLGTLCRQTINHRITRIRRMFRWASKLGEVPEDLYWKLKSVDAIPFGVGFEADDVDPVDWQVVSDTLRWLTPTVAAMVRIQLLCGMRPQDVCRMRPMDIDRSDPECWIYQPPKHKLSHLKKKRFIAIPPFAQGVIAAFLDRADDAHLFSPRESYRQYRDQLAVENRGNRKTKIYPAELRARAKRQAAAHKSTIRAKRTAYDTDSYRRAITGGLARAAKAGVTIPHWHPHQLRHTMSTSVSQLLGEQEAQRWLGHERLETTGLYTQRQVKELREIARRLSCTVSGGSASMITALSSEVDSYATTNRAAS